MWRGAACSGRLRLSADRGSVGGNGGSGKSRLTDGPRATTPWTAHEVRGARLAGPNVTSSPPGGDRATLGLVCGPKVTRCPRRCSRVTLGLARAGTHPFEGRALLEARSPEVGFSARDRRSP